MIHSVKQQEDILKKLNIAALNPMQEEAISVIKNTENSILLSPTGTGKTLAFLLPMIAGLNPASVEVQALILVPSRELAIQIEQVVRSMGSGFKVNAVYGGRPISKDKIELKHTPAILIGTPGRILDHFEGGRFSVAHIRCLILDEFDKSLETGFEQEMATILEQIPQVVKRILTSATQGVKIPAFVRLKNPKTIDYLQDKRHSKLVLKTVQSQGENKQNTLAALLAHIGAKQGIVFCNLKSTVEELSAYLERKNIQNSCFSGGMEQRNRERSLIKFRNGTSQVLIATDLAARGIDIPEINHVIHYELPKAVEDFIHRNGRTARVNNEGTAYIIQGLNERMPSFVNNSTLLKSIKKVPYTPSTWATVFVSGGRKDKISKGDIAGLFCKQGGLTNEQLGVIELKQDCAFVGVAKDRAAALTEKLNNSRLKKKKVRITII